MSNRGELKKLHEKGFALIYLHEKSKKPIDVGWTSQNKRSWEELENSFEKSYNVGVRLGEPSLLTSGYYLAAIDCDVKSKSRRAKEEMNEALRKLGIDLDSAPIVMSGRGNGSKHVYVQTKEPLRPKKYAVSEHKTKVLMPGENKPHSKRELEALTPEERQEGYRIRPAWEISFMGSGQQTVLPPSIHPDTGFAYAWANPFMVKRLPLFDASKFVRQEKAGEVSEKDGGLKFEAEDVDLHASKLGMKHIQMIENGRGCEDRSASLFGVTLAMCRAGFSDNQILSVLSNPEHWIAKAAYEHTQSRSRLKAVQWLYKYTLLKARYETDPMRMFENKPVLKPLPPREAERQEEDIQAEQEETLPDLDGNKKPKVTLRNIIHILEKFWGGGLVGFNEFNNRPYFLRRTPYGGQKGRELADHDDLALKVHLAERYRLEPSKELCFEAHSVVARRYAYHPVKSYLTGLSWDGVARLDTWLRKALGATGPEEYLSAVGRKVLVAAVARIFRPGTKFDYVLVLEGFQGKGKSTALQILASPAWFTDGLGDIHNKDVVDQMTGKWIIELGELASIRKAESESIKAFLSRQVDRVRMSYGRRSEDYPRQSIFVGSTNAHEYFTDETGNRRFWPVRIDLANRKWLREHRDQLWAEAVHLFEQGEKIYMNEALEEVAAKEQEKRFDVDDWEAEIKEIISKEPVGPFLTSNLWRAIHLSNGQPNMYDMRRIGKIMHRLGYVRKVAKLDGVNTKCWRKH